MSIALKLDQSGLTALQEEAAELGVTVEQLANDILKRHVRARVEGAKSRAFDPAFQAALAASLKENEELLRRLAK
jgi:hypothetical protein